MQLWTASQRKGVLMDTNLENEQKEYIFDEYEIQQEIDRLSVQYEMYMEQAI